ncbi:MAG: hypothetical protein HWE33_12510 [Rhodobacteraceae bacterium]|uniref:hypothetical protein n=1 Tax=Celeribacter sp. HF31 TaxID=2721558 RepID=UPI0014320B02|nr:hypothetical protein [Celeribacter sp. HF31]NIY80239.1 hypothetical protein [Celeribacter sp. HF31]NVK47118.1 hypothetical protein [Paracoccaceae bacterium]
MSPIAQSLPKPTPIPVLRHGMPAIRYISITSLPFMTLGQRPDIDLGSKPVFLAPEEKTTNEGYGAPYGPFDKK